jgi:DNA-directed RNA polymerase subunit RPC12/RpoP
MSPYDDSWMLDNLAVEMQLNDPMTLSIVDIDLTPTCGGCDAKLTNVSHDSRGREVRDYACGHRYIVGMRTVSIERV